MFLIMRCQKFQKQSMTGFNSTEYQLIKQTDSGNNEIITKIIMVVYCNFVCFESLDTKLIKLTLSWENNLRC